MKQTWCCYNYSHAQFLDMHVVCLQVCWVSCQSVRALFLSLNSKMKCMKKFVSWPKFSSLTCEHHKTKQIESAHMNRVVELNNEKVSWWHLLTWSGAGLYFTGSQPGIELIRKFRENNFLINIPVNSSFLCAIDGKLQAVTWNKNISRWDLNFQP